ncbi:MAG: hypothetical protein IPM66_19395 [Acidobacteriota bacterium]|nr:MAG: hypothetical protein IPM66_19395 [Acidobacteriota bacterium]
MMSKKRVFTIIALIFALYLAGNSVQARPEYLRQYAADPFSKPELRNRCSVCHVNPAGGGPRNDFGRAFAQAGFQITGDLRQRFPDRFIQNGGQPPVSFVEGSDSEAIVTIDGRKFVINTREKTVREIEAAPVVAETKPVPEAVSVPENVYRQGDVRLINLPTGMPIPKGSLWTDFTHRFPFSDPTSSSELFGLDSLAIPSFGFIYGVTDRIHVGAYRSPGEMGRPIMLYAGASLFDEQKGDPLTVMARIGLEGRDNFKRTFTTSFEATVARSITRHAQLYFVPTVSVGDRQISSDPRFQAPGETAVALGAGGAFNIRPSVALMAEANYRVNQKARYLNVANGIRRPVIGFGIQKVSSSRRHAFSLTFSNGPGTTFAQRSMTRGLLFSDDGFQGLTIGFNLSRRLF